MFIATSLVYHWSSVVDNSRVNRVTWRPTFPFIARRVPIYIISLLTALCLSTFALKALVDSQSSMWPRRFVPRTMVVLPSGWILHYSIKPLTIQWREKDPTGQAACNLRVDRHVTFPGMLRIRSVLSQTIWNGPCFFRAFPPTAFPPLFEMLAFVRKFRNEKSY
jgi:hypothetical protein